MTKSKRNSRPPRGTNMRTSSSEKTGWGSFPGGETPPPTHEYTHTNKYSTERLAISRLEKRIRRREYILSTCRWLQFISVGAVAFALLKLSYILYQWHLVYGTPGTTSVAHVKEVLLHVSLAFGCYVAYLIVTFCAGYITVGVNDLKQQVMKQIALMAKP